jgi:hypothetical protein
MLKMLLLLRLQSSIPHQAATAVCQQHAKQRSQQYCNVEHGVAAVQQGFLGMQSQQQLWGS